MNTALRTTVCGAAALFGMACAESGTTPSSAGSVAAFQSTPAGFSATNNSFAAGGDLDDAFMPHPGDGSFEGPDDHGRGRGRGPGGPGGPGGPDGRGGPGRGDGFGFLMGGGLGPDFFGAIGFGPGIGRGPFQRDSVGSSCVFASSTGVVTCGPVTNHGLSILVTAAIKTADGTAQSKPDSLTNSIVSHSEVSGTVTHRDSATSTVNHTSDRTVTGLAVGSTQRTVDGTAVGTETTTGTSDDGAFTAVRTVNDTTAGIVVPLSNGRPTYPTAGRVSRNMSIAVTIDGATTTHTRSEVISYDGSKTARITITQDGTSKSCTMTLPRGKLVCE